MVINLQFFGGRGASSGISEKGNAYGTQYKILLEYENIKFVTNAGKNYEALMETMTNGERMYKLVVKRFSELFRWMRTTGETG